MVPGSVDALSFQRHGVNAPQLSRKRFMIWYCQDADEVQRGQKSR